MTEERRIELRAAVDNANDEATLVEAMDRVLHADRTGGAELDRDPLTPSVLAEWLATVKRTFPVTKDGEELAVYTEGGHGPHFVELQPWRADGDWRLYVAAWPEVLSAFACYRGYHQYGDDPSTRSLAPDPEMSGWRVPYTDAIRAWQSRPADLRGATVTVTASPIPMVRRPRLISTTLRTPWIEAVAVDGAPMAALIPDGGAVFDQWNRTRTGLRRYYRPRGEQHELKLRGVPPIPRDVRLVALAPLDPHHGLIDDATVGLAGDVLTLMAYAHAIDRPMTLSARDGAALLARTRSGDFRAPQASDVKRFRLATFYLRRMIVTDPAGGSAPRWLDLAHVSAAIKRPDGLWSVEIGPPAWARPLTDQWTLTAEGSAAGRLRPTAGERSMAGRIITGIEYRLAARCDPRFAIAPYLQPENGRAAGPGRPLTIAWPEVLHLAGDFWDKTDAGANKTAYQRFKRAVEWLREGGYWVPSTHAEAPAGDSVEFLDATLRSRARPTALIVRASSRFVEAARIAQQNSGPRFRSMRLIEYAGMDRPINRP